MARKQNRRPVARKAKRTPGALFDKLVRLQARLRAPNGCPWDREQTPQSLRTFLVEEAYEVLDALESGAPDELAGELGDLLLQIIFHALMASEAGQFDIRDVIEHVHRKMVRRHPHVFGKTRAKSSADVLRNWERLKAEERKSPAPSAANSAAENAVHGAVHNAAADLPPSLLDGVPRGLPALLEAAKLGRRASHVGFDWARAEDILEKIREECAELQSILGSVHLPPQAARVAPATAARLEDETGDLLFTAVNVARFLGIDPEIALKNANRKFSRRFRWMEAEAARDSKRKSLFAVGEEKKAPSSAFALADISRDEMARLWNRAKAAESLTKGQLTSANILRKSR
jgi:MazG family protein